MAMSTKVSGSMKNHKEMALIPSQMATNTQGIGIKGKDRAMVLSNSQIMRPILDLLKIMSSMGKALSFLVTAVLTRGHSQKASERVREFSYGRMVKSMMDNGSKVSMRVKGSSLGLMAKNTQGRSKTVARKERVPFIVLTAPYTKANGKPALRRGAGSLLILKAKKQRVLGSKIK